MNIAKKPLAAALGAAFLATSIAPLVCAEANPFSAQTLNAGYDLANFDKPAEGKCGEGKCGEGKCGDKMAEGKCGEGKCGEGKCGGNKAEGTDTSAEGAAATDADKAAHEGSCGDKKAQGEGKCGGQ